MRRRRSSRSRRLERYRARYRDVAVVAGLHDELDAAGPLEVVEDRVGTASIDFWGISFSPCSLETEPMGEAGLERSIALLRACWQVFDEVALAGLGRAAARAAGRRTGPRRRSSGTSSGSRARTSPSGWGCGSPSTSVLDPEARRAYRDAYVAGLRAYDTGEGRRMRSWNLPFLVRHSAFHTMDHAWEMQDKDLTGR